ncbi:MAG: endonuclease III [Erysipelotrichaceae bacterium]|nr:endonuclease III [Erysipelotrichaceae bacterium]MDD3924566.1 endonuclease III [Erysipelotrichaceae bacterium]MDD4642160.1 endonuclease III [Erysipelotrichaceae bacterium]
MNDDQIFNKLQEMFPNAQCELNYKDPYQLTVAVMLSAQTTDIAVNKVTINLFDQYPNVFALASADIDNLKSIIKTIGLYHNKAKNLIAMAKIVASKFDGKIINDQEVLMSLPGIGRKSANVIRSECFNEATIAVDTHVYRVALRLGYAEKNASLITVERNLMERFDKGKWHSLHHLLIFFGRYHCHAKKPKCESCPFTSICKKDALD